MKRLWKTNIEIWTDYNPTGMEIADLGHESTHGDAFCTRMTASLVTPAKSIMQAEGFSEFFELKEEG